MNIREKMEEMKAKRGQKKEHSHAPVRERTPEEIEAHRQAKLNMVERLKQMKQSRGSVPAPTQAPSALPIDRKEMLERFRQSRRPQ